MPEPGPGRGSRVQPLQDTTEEEPLPGRERAVSEASSSVVKSQEQGDRLSPLSSQLEKEVNITGPAARSLLSPLHPSL